MLVDRLYTNSVLALFPFPIHTTHYPQHKEPFTDPDFPPADCSLYGHETTPPLWGVYQWLRPADIKDPYASSKVKWTVFRNPGPEDIAQGVLGNCW